MAPEELIKKKLEVLKEHPDKLTPLTRRTIVVFLGLALLGFIAAPAMGIMTIDDIQVPVASIITGFFTLLTGDR